MSDKAIVLWCLAIFTLIAFFVVDMSTKSRQGADIVTAKRYTQAYTYITWESSGKNSYPVTHYVPESYTAVVRGYGHITVPPLEYDKIHTNDTVLVTYSVGRITGIKYTSGAELARVEN